ncbi:semaphorin-5A-like [Lingula anatina]|uniref:Semaphorin-5A-like n=1 Tax=Lingula anatina TaxID=7574 RepID=A0A1S3IW45_LINAN|nr:semaphorin-5A-like [Lingula anatina]|eukprot:XP_013402410.1 semaphorin-5A-like [Lingula anatina]
MLLPVFIVLVGVVDAKGADSKGPFSVKAEIAAWSGWSKFTLCTASCGGGVQIRRRECVLFPVRQEVTDILSKCTGSDIDIRPCNVHTCVVQGGWTEWSIFTPCCGGKTVRHRTCTNPAPINAPACSGNAIDVMECPKYVWDGCGCPRSCLNMRSYVAEERIHGAEVRTLGDDTKQLHIQKSKKLGIQDLLHDYYSK